MKYSQRSRGKNPPSSPPNDSGRWGLRNLPMILASATRTTVTELSKRNPSNVCAPNGISVASVVQFLPPDDDIKRKISGARKVSAARRFSTRKERQTTKRDARRKSPLRCRHSIGGALCSDAKVAIPQQRHSLNAVRPLVYTIRQRLMSERRRSGRKSLTERDLKDGVSQEKMKNEVGREGRTDRSSPRKLFKKREAYESDGVDFCPLSPARLVQMERGEGKGLMEVFKYCDVLFVVFCAI